MLSYSGSYIFGKVTYEIWPSENLSRLDWTLIKIFQKQSCHERGIIHHLTGTAAQRHSYGIAMANPSMGAANQLHLLFLKTRD